MKCGAVLRGSFSLAWGSAGQALSSLHVLPLCSGMLSTLWRGPAWWISSLSPGPGQSLQLAVGGKFGWERKGLLDGDWTRMEGKGALGFSLHCGLDKLPVDPQWVWD